MWLSEARADIPVHLMGPNPGPGHGGMSCASPSKPTFSTAWRHNRNAKNAQSRAKNIPLEGKLLCWRKAILTLGDYLLCHLERRLVEIGVFDQLLQESLLGFHLGFPVIGGAKLDFAHSIIGRVF